MSKKKDRIKRGRYRIKEKWSLMKSGNLYFLHDTESFISLINILGLDSIHKTTYYPSTVLYEKWQIEDIIKRINILPDKPEQVFAVKAASHKELPLDFNYQIIVLNKDRLKHKILINSVNGKYTSR